MHQLVPPVIWQNPGAPDSRREAFKDLSGHHVGGRIAV